jgi:hypothetical protein
MYIKGKTFITSCCLFALMAGGTAFAQQEKLTSGPYKGAIPSMAVEAPPPAPLFYTNLVVNPCTACNYNTDNDYFVIGPNNCFAPRATHWIAYPFASTKTGNVRQVMLAITTLALKESKVFCRGGRVGRNCYECTRHACRNRTTAGGSNVS